MNNDTLNTRTRGTLLQRSTLQPRISVDIKRKKEEIWLSPMTKAPTPTEMSKGQSDNTNNATKKFD